MPGRGVGIDVGEEQHQLLAAGPDDQLAHLLDVGEPVGELEQQLLAGPAPAALPDARDVLQVDREQRHAQAPDARAFQRLGEGVGRAVAVRAGHLLVRADGTLPSRRST